MQPQEERSEEEAAEKPQEQSEEPKENSEEKPEHKPHHSEEEPKDKPQETQEKTEERRGRRGRATAPSEEHHSAREAESPQEDDGTTSSCSTVLTTSCSTTLTAISQSERWATVRMVMVREWPEHSSPWGCARCGAQWCGIRQPPAHPSLDGGMLRASLEELSRMENDMERKQDSNQRRLLALKRNTQCVACGKKGHWRGDPECGSTRA